MAHTTLTCHELECIFLSSKPKMIVTTSSRLSVILEALALLPPGVLGNQLASHIFIADDGCLSNDAIFGNAHTAWVDGLNGQKVKLTNWMAVTSAHLRIPTSHEPFSFENPQLESRLRIAVIAWSSGTSGKIKGVNLSHRAFIHSTVSFWHQKLDYGADEKAMGLVPFCHIMGLLVVVLFPIVAGSTVYVVQKFEPRNFLEVITKNKITSLQIAPPIAQFLAKSSLVDEHQYDLSSLSNLMSGGAPIAPAILETVWKRCGFWIKSGYGLSEALHVANQLGSTTDELSPQLGTVGEVMYGIDLKVVSIDTQQILEKEVEGEIVIKSCSLMNSYLGNDVETRLAVDEGWFRTGDLGFLDLNNRLSITGRLKEMIKVKGFQVAPSDLEKLINNIEAVAEVAVTSHYSDDQGTELPRAYVVPRDENLTKICESIGRHEIGLCDPMGHSGYQELVKIAFQVKQLVESQMVHYKWLRGNIVLTSHIPKSPSGKVLKKLLPQVPGIEIKLYPEKTNYLPGSKL